MLRRGPCAHPRRDHRNINPALAAVDVIEINIGVPVILRCAFIVLLDMHWENGDCFDLFGKLIPDCIVTLDNPASETTQTCMIASSVASTT